MSSKKTKRGKTEELTYLEEVESVKESEIDMLRMKKRKKESKKEQLQMEQEVSVLLSAYEDADYSEESDDDDDDRDASQRKPAWVDEEEASTAVNIAKVNNRLRKLRKEEDESLVTGSEFVSRLRAQHVELNPGTDWAQLDSWSEVDKSSNDESTDEENEVAGSRGH